MLSDVRKERCAETPKEMESWREAEREKRDGVLVRGGERKKRGGSFATEIQSLGDSLYEHDGRHPCINKLGGRQWVLMNKIL